MLPDNAIEVRWTEGGKPAGYALINPGGKREAVLPEGEWEALLLNEMFEPDTVQPVSGTVTVDGRTVLLLRAQ